MSLEKNIVIVGNSPNKNYITPQNIKLIENAEIVARCNKMETYGTLGTKLDYLWLEWNTHYQFYESTNNHQFITPNVQIIMDPYWKKQHANDYNKILTDEQYNNIITQKVYKNDLLNQLGIQTKIKYITIPRSLIRLTYHFCSEPKYFDKYSNYNIYLIGLDRNRGNLLEYTHQKSAHFDMMQYENDYLDLLQEKNKLVWIE